MIEFGKTFAVIHNDCLVHIYQELYQAETRSPTELNEEDIKKLILSSANSYISQNNLTREAEGSPLTSEMYLLTIKDIENSLSAKEKEYIDKFLLNQLSSVNELLNEISSDLELQEIQKQAVICFITTYQASSEYWSKHSDEWSTLLNKPQTRARWQDVVFADAWWGYQGLVSSGLNPWVGGGSAAVGSACAFL